MHMGRVNDVTHCYNLISMKEGIFSPGSSCILIRYRFTNERLSTSVETIGLPRFVREVTWARFPDRLLKGIREAIT